VIKSRKKKIRMHTKCWLHKEEETVLVANPLLNVTEPASLQLLPMLLILIIICKWGRALCYKPEGHEFDSRWDYWIFQIT
jgi:hypothetical protein